MVFLSRTHALSDLWAGDKSVFRAEVTDSPSVHCRPKLLCTKSVFYIYLIVVAVLFMLFGGAIVASAAFPLYSLYLSPYLPTHRNLNTYSNTVNRTVQELVMDGLYYRNFSTNAMFIPDNYRQLLNATLVSGESSFANCKSFLDTQDFWTIVHDVEGFSQHKDAIMATLPPASVILSGLNATFYPYLDYLPLHVRLVQDVVTFIKDGNYTYAGIKEFSDNHHIFTRDLLQLTVAEAIDVVRDPLSVVNTAFQNDLVSIYDAVMKNVTSLGTELVEKSSTAYNQGFAIVNGFIRGEDLHSFEEIPEEFVDVFSLLQEKFVYYRDMYLRLKNVFSEFMSCMMNQGDMRVGEVKQYMISTYLGYFKKHYLYSGLAVIVCLLILALTVYVIVKGVGLMKETLQYAKSLIEVSSEEMLDAMNDLGDAVK